MNNVMKEAQMAKQVALKKRAMIDKATQKMFLTVCVAGVVLGLTLVASIYFIKWINFNSKVIGRKAEIIEDYKTIQKNVEVLKTEIVGDGSEDGSYLANNEYLEVIARGRGSDCITLDGSLVNMSDDIELTRTCSALRVIPDALPSVENSVAVYASLNKLFLMTEVNGQTGVVEPDSISPGGNSTTDSKTGLSTIPVNLSIRENGSTTKAILDTIERSIRNFDIQSVTIAWWGGNGEASEIELRGSAAAYYSAAVEATTKTETIYADDANAKKGSK